MSNRDVYETSDPNGAKVVFDTRYFPIFIHEWHGTATMKIAEEHYPAREPVYERARREGAKLVIITDLSNASTPPATVRKLLGEKAQSDANVDELIGYVILVPSAVMRGVVTALSWIIGENVKPIVYARSMEDALEKATKMAEHAGVTYPPVKYQPRE